MNFKMCINFIYIVITTCFVESSLQVVENQRSVVFSVMLSNPSSANILLRIFSNKESATGELKIYTYARTMSLPLSTYVLNVSAYVCTYTNIIRTYVATYVVLNNHTH